MSYDVPKEIQDLAKTMNNFSYSNGLDISQVFDDFLVYIISFFTPVVKPVVEWKYSPEQNAVFHTMLIEWVKIMEKQIYLKQWYDAFGDLYMGLIAGSSRTSGRGQFFTPPEICDLMTSAMGDKDIIGKYVSDPTCGSGRTLLSWHVRHLGNYLCAEDIDRTCCMMTVCNMLIHGCEGEVIWHNSLEPDSFLGGWKVNYNLNRPGSTIPFIRVDEMTKEESIVIRIWENKLKQVSTLPNTTRLNVVQLSLFN